MNKKGVEHIEMILSFVIFASALFVAFIFFHPFSSSHVSPTLLEQIYSNVEERLSTDLVIATFIVNASQITTQHRFTVSLYRSFPVPWQVRAVTANGAALNSSLTNRGTGEIEFDWKGSHSPYVTILLSPEITPSVPPFYTKQLGVNDSDPWKNWSVALKFASLTSRKVLSERKINALRTSYSNDAVYTKNSLGIPPEVSYGFQFISASGKVITDVPLQEAGDFRIKSKRIDALYSNGTLEYSELGVGIW